MPPSSKRVQRRGERAPMQNRRFGRANKAVSVITLGGMRFPHGWSAPRSELPAATIDTCRDTAQIALALGIKGSKSS